MSIENLNNKMEDNESAQSQHQKGKLTARERIHLLLDEGSFIEFDPLMESRFSDFEMDKKKLAGDAVITGFGKINNRPVYVYSQDFSKMGGSLGEMHGEKIVRVIDSALKTGCPIIGIIDSGGARIQEGIASLDGYAKIFKSMVRASGVIPQISIMAGPSAGGASYAPGLSDFIFMVQGISQMYITGPEVIKKVIGEDVGFEDLGGAQVHASKSGCAHFVFDNEKDCFSGVKKLLSYLPQNNLEDPLGQKTYLAWTEEGREELSKIVPEEQEKVYDMKLVIEEIFDKNSFFEIHSRFAANAVIGLARLSGNAVGIVANQTKFLAGVLDIDSSDKIARFVRFCDAFNLPLINLVDTPGYLPGTSQEHQGIIRHGAKVLYAYAEASVPKISLIIRKAFGGAYIALCSRHLGYDKVIAWPKARIAVMGAEQAVKIIYRKQIAENPNIEKEKIEELKSKFLNPFEAAKLGQIDMIIEPKETRTILIKCLDSLLTKREQSVPKKHGNIPT
jgi:acetyl-CoA carboxylase carboxyltransferase component